MNWVCVISDYDNLMNHSVSNQDMYPYKLDPVIQPNLLIME